MNNARFIIQVCKGLIRHGRARRTLMFYTTVVLLVLCFVGATFLSTWLRGHPLIFLGFWGLVAWLTMLIVLLALYDMVKVRADGRRAHRQLEESMRHGGQPNSDDDDSHTP